MTLEELRKMARELDIPHEHEQCLASLVRAIQRQSGETDCFGSDDCFQCTHVACRWRRDCLKPIAIGWR